LHFNYSPKASKGLFPKILVNDVKCFPIPDIDSDTNEHLKNLAINQTYRYCAELDKEIDRLVYELFALTSDEINIIENSVSN
jgi:hypothetical protein